MRTTLTLDPDVAALVEDVMRREGRGLKDVVNAGLRKGLRPEPPAGRRRRFRVEPHRSRLAPGVDPRGLNQLADELEDEVLTSRWPVKR